MDLEKGRRNQFSDYENLFTGEVPRTKCVSFLMKRVSNKTFSANSNGTYIAIKMVNHKPGKVCSAVATLGKIEECGQV
jgi:hypothetical protein